VLHFHVNSFASLHQFSACQFVHVHVLFLSMCLSTFTSDLPVRLSFIFVFTKHHCMPVVNIKTVPVCLFVRVCVFTKHHRVPVVNIKTVPVHFCACV
jgi:hypothetical protein